MGVFDNFSTYPASVRPAILVDFLLDLLTLRYSDIYLSVLNNGVNTPYTGKVFQNVTVRLESLEFDSSYRDSCVDLTLSNFDIGATDTRVSDLIDTTAFLGRACNVLFGDVSEDHDSAKLLFSGIIDVDSPPRIKPDRVDFRICDLFGKMGSFVRSFSLSDYPDMDSSVVGKVIPWVFGDWVSDVDDMYLIPAYWIGANRYKIADHELFSIDDVIVARGNDWKPVIFYPNLPLGEMTIDHERAPGDQVFVKCKGLPIASGGAVADTPALVVETIVKNVFSLSSSVFGNKADYDSITNHLKVRRYIKSDVEAADLLQSLAGETNSYLSHRFFSGQTPINQIYVIPYKPWFGRLQTDVDSTKQFEDYDVIKADIIEKMDSRRYFANRLNWKTASNWFSGDLIEQSGILTVLDRMQVNKTYDWLYLPSDVRATASRELALRSEKVLV